MRDINLKNRSNMCWRDSGTERGGTKLQKRTQSCNFSAQCTCIKMIKNTEHTWKKLFEAIVTVFSKTSLSSSSVFIAADREICKVFRISLWSEMIFYRDRKML